jgi:hypothetical protein
VAEGLDAIANDEATGAILAELEAMGCPVSIEAQAELPQEPTHGYALTYKKLCVSEGLHTASTLHFLLTLEGAIQFAGGYYEVFEISEDDQLYRAEFYGMVGDGTGIRTGLDIISWRSFLPSPYEGGFAYLQTSVSARSGAAASLPVVDVDTGGAEAYTNGDTCRRCIDELESGQARIFNDCQRHALLMATKCTTPTTATVWEEAAGQPTCGSATDFVTGSPLACDTALNPESPEGRDAVAAACAANDPNALGAYSYRCNQSWCTQVPELVDGTNQSCANAEVVKLESTPTGETLIREAAPYCVLLPEGTNYGCCTSPSGEECDRTR